MCKSLDTDDKKLLTKEEAIERFKNVIVPGLKALWGPKFYRHDLYDCWYNYLQTLFTRTEEINKVVFTELKHFEDYRKF